jgi:hypothetical protein
MQQGKPEEPEGYGQAKWGMSPTQVRNLLKRKKISIQTQADIKQAEIRDKEKIRLSNSDREFAICYTFFNDKLYKVTLTAIGKNVPAVLEKYEQTTWELDYCYLRELFVQRFGNNYSAPFDTLGNHELFWDLSGTQVALMNILNSFNLVYTKNDLRDQARAFEREITKRKIH